MRKSVVVLLALIAVFAIAGKAFSMDGDNVDASYSDDGADSELLVVNRPVDTQGLNGLLFMNSAFTQPAGHVAVGTFLLYEKSTGLPQSFSIIQGGASLTMGITNAIEVGVKGKGVRLNYKGLSSPEIGQGDTDVLVKWKILSQEESHPALALGFAWSFPTGDKTKGLNEINEESVRFMLMASKEKRFLDNSFIGVYLEAQEVMNDVSRESSALYDKYAVFSAGALFPISDDNRVQAMLEYGRTYKKGSATFGTYKDYSGLTPGLRFVTEHLNVSAGIQFLNKTDSDYPNDQQYVGTISYTFP
jgi:hypothetical protein